MQWKMPPPARLADRFHRWALRRGFPALAWITPRWPRGLLFFGARLVITIVMAVYPGPKRCVERNLRRVLGPEATRRTIRRARQEMLHQFAFTWVDLFRFAQLPREAAQELMLDVDGLEHLEGALGAGHGVLLLTAHLGGWEIGSVLFRGRDLPISVVYVPDRYGVVESFRSRFRTEGEVEEIPLDPRSAWAALPVLKALRSGRIVALQGDRDPTEKGPRVDFFGAPVVFPLGPFTLAHLTGAPLVPAFVTYDTAYRFQVEFGAPIRVGRERDRNTAIAEALESWVGVLESAVRRWPTQWYTFYDFWGDQSPDLVAAKVEERPA